MNSDRITRSYGKSGTDIARAVRVGLSYLAVTAGYAATSECKRCAASCMLESFKLAMSARMTEFALLPADLLKLYIYGYLNRVRPSRRLEA
jgi:hypothetical protein